MTARVQHQASLQRAASEETITRLERERIGSGAACEHSQSAVVRGFARAASGEGCGERGTSRFWPRRRPCGTALRGHSSGWPEDARTRECGNVRADEARHRETAISLGAAELPAPAKVLMRAMAKVMTAVDSRI